MSANEFELGAVTFPRPEAGRALLAASVAVLLALSCGVMAFFAGVHLLSHPQRAASAPPFAPEPAPVEWMIEGALTEACTCTVPCTCNFGEGPSPHDYCHAFYAYDIRKGRYGEVALDGLRFGAADLASGRTLFIDERASPPQREALLVIMARVVRRASAAEAEARAHELAKEVRYAKVQQEYDKRRNRLEVEGIGVFAADYIMGLDKRHPVVVRNNTTWRIRDAIKARTSLFRVTVGRDKIDVKDTNSNQGDFEYTNRTDFSGAAEWSCGASGSHKAHATGEAMCGKQD